MFPTGSSWHWLCLEKSHDLTEKEFSFYAFGVLRNADTFVSGISEGLSDLGCSKMQKNIQRNDLLFLLLTSHPKLTLVF